MNKRLYRSRDDKMVFGVCGGIADYFDIDPTWIRLGFVILLLSGTGFFAYIIAAIIIPEKPIVVQQTANEPKAADPEPVKKTELEEEKPMEEDAPVTEEVPESDVSEESIEKVADSDVTIE